MTIAAPAATPNVADQKPQIAAALPFGVFGSLEFRTNATKGLGEWRRVQSAMRAEQKTYDDCDAGGSRCPAHLRDWRGKLKSWRASGETAQLQLVNSWINRKIRYTEDRKAFGVKDLWASPAVSLNGRGDCEDYAIAKYASLKALGIGEDRMRIVIVNDTRKKIGHAVLSVRTAAGVYILDNQNAEPVLHQRISHYAPVYSINAGGRWINIATRQIKTQYANAYEKGGDPALEPKPAKAVKVASNSAMPLELILRPTTAAGEPEAIVSAGKGNARPIRDRAQDRY